MKKVLVGGAFDLFHYGHLCMLEWAKSLGDYLIVHVNTDKRVKFKKGKDRPIVPEDERVAIIKAIKYVDKVHTASFPNRTVSILKALKDTQPDIYARNIRANRQTLEKEKKLCKKLGIKIVFYSDFPRSKPCIHTTEIINKAKTESMGSIPE